MGLRVKRGSGSLTVMTHRHDYPSHSSSCSSIPPDRRTATTSTASKSPPPSSFGDAKKLYSRERFSRPRPETVQCELRLLSGLDIDQEVVVLLLRRLALPIEVSRIARRHLDGRAARQNWVLFCTAAAQQQVLHTVHLVELGRVNVPVEHDDLEVLRVRRDDLVGIL